MLAHLLTDKELALVLEVLQVESERTVIETKRSYSAEMTRELRSRLRALNRLVERFQEFQSGDLKACK